MSYISRLTQAVIDLDALVKNYQYIDSLAPNSNTIAVIKADAYGHDANKVAHALSATVNTFAVGFIDEAMALRSAGINNTVLILEGPFKENDFQLAQLHNFSLMLHSDYQIAWLRSLNVEFSGDIWLKVETGMNRLGFHLEQVDHIMTQLSQQQRSKLVLCSHFSSAEQLDSVKPVEQLAKLMSLVEKYHCQFSMANSAGILNWPASHGDHTRLGLALYGISPIGKSPLSQPLIPVMTLQANIIAIHTLKIGETVGYGDIWQAKRKSTIATVAIGYADGYPRNAKLGTPVFIKGKVAPLVGRVSMDMITVDITDLTNINIGDTVELWGKNISIDIVAQHSDSINYELLTRVSKRVPKVVTG
ncbi:alanine racemase [Colwellia sp. MT41]|uniref:Alanine racemase n=1 Tax=Colwellia marinimaniae TaxID=1513592 RepID=A0ABQ0MXA9_9GAMM|nr:MULTISPECIES: alanine racemase [Colwellia]ALO34645.1 alanine racemase [Colwellia sp. MT41]GAW97009.1 alanine racemase, catabolic [Colwellia marinimaniae]